MTAFIAGVIIGVACAMMLPQSTIEKIGAYVIAFYRRIKQWIKK